MKFVKASCTYLSQGMARSLRTTGTVLIIAWSLFSSALAQDVLIFTNGDRLTGTIQRIQRGVVAFLAPNIDGEIKIGSHSRGLVPNFPGRERCGSDAVLRLGKGRSR